MPRFFSLPESLAHTKEEKVKEKKWVEKTGEVVGKKGLEASPKTPRTHNKLHKPRPFSLAVPTSRKRTTSLSARPTSVHIPSLSTDSSSDSSSTDQSTIGTPTKLKSEPKHRLRAISLRSVRSISSSLKHRYSHSHLSSSAASTASSSDSSTKESTMAPSVTTLNGDSASPSPSPKKAVPHKVVSKVKKSIRRLGSHLHLPHVTSHLHLRPRSSSDSHSTSSSPPVDFDDRRTPSPSPDTILDIGSVHSRRVSSTKANFGEDGEADAEHTREEEQPEELEAAPEGAGAHSPYEHLPGLQVNELGSIEPLVIVPIILSPVEEMPTPLEPIAIAVKSPVLDSETPRIDTTIITGAAEFGEEDNSKSAEEKDVDREKESREESELNLSEMDKHTAEAVSVAAPDSESAVIPPVSPSIDQNVPLLSSESPMAEEEDSYLPVSSLPNPIPFLPTARSYRSLYSTNMLLWWLPKSTSMYNICTKF